MSGLMLKCALLLLIAAFSVCDGETCPECKIQWCPFVRMVMLYDNDLSDPIKWTKYVSLAWYRTMLKALIRILRSCFVPRLLTVDVF